MKYYDDFFYEWIVKFVYLLIKVFIFFKVKFVLYFVNFIVEVFWLDIFELFVLYYIYIEELVILVGLFFCKFIGILFF